MAPSRSVLALRAILVALCASHALAMYGPSSAVIELTPGNFQSKLKAAGIMFVEFYAPWCGHCKNLAADYEKTAKALKGMVAVGAVDADAHQSLGSEHGVKGFPTLKLFYMDGSNIKSQDYNGGRDAKSMAAFILDKAKSLAMKRLGGGGGGGSGGAKKPSGGGGGAGGGGGGGGGGAGDGFYGGTHVVTLTDASFSEEVTDSDDLWLVEFYAPWCGHCKNLKPHWIEAAKELEGKVKLGAVDCTVHQSVCSEFGVQGYPTIKYFGTNKNSPSDYQGGRETGGIVSWATEKWAKQAPPKEVRELVDQHVFEKECVGDGEGAKAAQLCFIVFLPDILDSGAAGRNAYIDTLKKVADKYKDRPWSYLWAPATQHAALEANFGVGGAGYPALVAFKPKDSKFSTSKSAFELTHVIEYIESLRVGGGSSVPISGSLAQLSDITPWDGKDGVLEEEDEFSLDDIMGDDDEPPAGADKTEL